MAAGTVTQIADMLIPDVWHPYMIQLSTELDAFIQSGVAVDVSSVIEEFGTTIHLPFFNDLSGAANVSTDQVDMVVNNLTTSSDMCAKAMRDIAFGASDLSSELSGADPMGAIAMRIGAFWMRQRQATLIASLQGAFQCSNINVDVGGSGTTGNVLDITGLTGSPAAFDAYSFIDATHQLGDHSEALRAIAIHSDTYRAMKKMELIDFKQASTEGQPIPVYQDRRVIVDDKMPVTALTSGPNAGANAYDTYIFGPGAVAWATAQRKMPAEAWRDPLKNGGREYLVTREQWVMHPRGIKWLGANVSGATPADTEFANPANWSKVYMTKNVRCVRFRHLLAS